MTCATLPAMCNHYRYDEAVLADPESGWPKGDDVGPFSHERIAPRFPGVQSDVYPDRLALVGRMDQNGAVVPDAMRWGFPPVQGRVVTNIRHPEKPFWRPWLKAEYRCLVPATRFAEWSAGPPKGERWFALPDGRPFCFAGIWRPWRGVRGTKAAPVEGEHRLFAFLTTEPNAVVAPIHAKAMPVILAREDWDTWLTGSTEEALALQRPWPDEGLRVLG